MKRRKPNNPLDFRDAGGQNSDESPARPASGCPRRSDRMTKADIVNSLYEKIGLSKKETAHIVEVVLETVKENLERGEKIKLAGFGNFVVRRKVARKGRNPKTGEEIEISRRRVVTFRPSQILRKVANP
jgi:integration host factor subunit alpha